MAEKVQLHTAYYLDPKFVGASGYEERLFVRLLAFCGANETGGVLPPNPWKHVGIPDARKAFAGLVSRGLIVPVDPFAVCPACARAVPDVRPTCAARVPHVCPACAAPVPAHTVQTQLVGWKKWQSNVDELARRRENERTRQANHRALSEGKSRDIPEMSRTLGKGREGKGDRNVGSAAASSERASAPREPSTHFADGTPIPGVGDADVVPFRRDRGPTPSPGANTLAATFCPTGTPGTQIRALAVVVQELIDDPHVQRADLEAGLAAWRDRPGAGPRLLPGLVTDAAKIRAAPAGSPGTSAVADKVAGWLAVGQQFANDPNSQKGLDQ